MKETQALTGADVLDCSTVSSSVQHHPVRGQHEGSGGWDSIPCTIVSFFSFVFDFLCNSLGFKIPNLVVIINLVLGLHQQSSLV